MICRGIERRSEAAGAAISFEVVERDGHGRHQVCARCLGQDADRVVIIRRRAKAAVPPRVEGRICRHSRLFFCLQIGCHLVADHSDVAKYGWSDTRIRRVVKWRYHQPRAGLAHLMNVVHDLREPLLPEKLGDRLCLDEIEHEPVAVVVVAGVMVIKLGWCGALAFCAECFAVPVGDDVYAVGIRRRYQQQDGVIEYFKRVGIFRGHKVESQVHRHL